MNQQQLENLVQKYADGEASDEEVRQLMHWYRSANISEVYWPEADEGEKHRLHERMLNRLQSEISSGPARLYTFSWKRAAAVIIFTLGLATVTYNILAPRIGSYYTVTNPNGKIHFIQLPDSSKVWLNASSTLKYSKFFHAHRKLILEGEAFFEVTKDPAHPFTITTGQIATTVVGTSFNIKAYPADSLTNVSVITGKVKVSKLEKELAMLTPSRAVLIDNRNMEAKLFEADTSDVVSWKNGRLQFKGRRMDDIAVTLERWYGYSFQFKDPRIKNCRFYLSFDNRHSIDNVLSVIKQVAGLDYKIDHTHKKIILSGKGCR